MLIEAGILLAAYTLDVQVFLTLLYCNFKLFCIIIKHCRTHVNLGTSEGCRLPTMY